MTRDEANAIFLLAGIEVLKMLFPARTIPDCRFWCRAKCNDGEGYALFRRHYSFNPNSDHKAASGRFIGPGSPLALITPCGLAIFGWRKFIDDCIDQRTGKRQQGVNCCYFRDERPSHEKTDGAQPSDLIREASAIAWAKWPGERLYTYVDPRQIGSPNPGYCFKCAGWRECGVTAGGLVVLEALWREESPS